MNLAIYDIFYFNLVIFIYQCDIKLDGETLRQVEQFKYLGSIFVREGGCKEDVKTRCLKAAHRPVKLWFDPKQIATETISPELIQKIYPEHHIKNII